MEKDFVKNAAHELRTPVSAISSAIEVLQDGAKNDPEARDRFLGHIEQATARLERLLDAVLVLARAQTGEEQPALSTVPLEPVLRQVFDGITPHAGVSLEIEAPPVRGASTITYVMPWRSRNASVSSRWSSSSQLPWRNSTSFSSPPSCSCAHSR